jgi:type I restriction enzyme M protein
MHMKNEKITDFFIGGLLSNSNIEFTPNGSSIKEIQEALKSSSKKGTGNVGFPEFTAKSKEFILVIEDKALLEQQANYEDAEKTRLATDTKSITNYAENGALHYAQQIIAKTSFKKVFAFGCSGDETHHAIRPIFVDEKSYKLLNKIDGFENFSPENIEQYYREQILGETPPEVLETQDLIDQAKTLHEDLRNYGQLGDKEKPLVVSAILLALQYDDFSVENLKGHKQSTDGNKIFNAVESYMKEVDVSPEVKLKKVLHQFNIIKDRTILSQVDKRLKNKDKKNELAKTPLRYFTEFIQNNILASIKANTKEDILGRFYGEFMRYSGGDGQSLGVVLTPDHITELFCDLVELQPTDNVFDPCCGTAGFLVAAMHQMESKVPDEETKKNIKSNQLHGIEVREDMFSIATTNMILRDDGKSNLIVADFLSITTEELRKNNYTVGFMNPPYSQSKGVDTYHLSEIHFIEHLLDSLADGARSVIIVPQSTMVGKNKIDKQVKKRILEKHTLEGVITLNKETFYRIGTNPCIAVFTSHKPHNCQKNCKFINFEDDGFEIAKHKGLKKTERAKERKAHLLNCWLHDAPAETKFMVKTTIEPEDEWLHAFYYFNDEIPTDADFDKTIGDYLGFEFNMIMQGRGYLFEEGGESE